MLGDKIKDPLYWLMDNTVAKTHSAKIFKVIEYIDELIEKTERADELAMLQERGEAQRKYCVKHFEELREEVETLNEVSESLLFNNKELRKEIELGRQELFDANIKVRELEPDTLLGKALKLLGSEKHKIFRTSIFHTFFHDGVFMLSYHPRHMVTEYISLEEWYQQQLEKEGNND